MADQDYIAATLARRNTVARISSTPPSTPRPFADNVDASHPLYVDFPLPAGIVVQFARLSFRFRLYRTYSTLSGLSTGGGSSHNHGSAAHTHDMFTIGGVPPASTNTTWFANPAASNPIVLITPNAGSTSPLTSYSTTPGATDPEASHTHTVTGTSSLGVTESGSNTTITAISIDGLDVTASLGGGPWGSDTLDLDLTSLMPVGNGAFHTIALTPSGLGRIVGELRLG